MPSIDVVMSPLQRSAYLAALRALGDARVDFLVGGGFALQTYMGVRRSTKDLDVFLRAGAVERALEALARAGFHTEMTNPGWLAKGRRRGALIDLIFCSYNGLFPVDEGWFENARDARVVDVPVRIVGPEEMIVSKCFVAARDRFDGSDISWLLRKVGHTLDWRRIEELMAPHWQVLLWQLVHYLYVFPSERAQVPAPLVQRLLRRLSHELGSAPDEIDAPPCRGSMLDQIHYPPIETETRGDGDTRDRSTPGDGAGRRCSDGEETAKG